VRQFITSSLVRRALYGLAMGATIVAIITSPWGKQSGGHFNPAVTFTFYRLGKVDLWDTVFYVAAQFIGATCGVVTAAYVLRGAPENHAVRYAVTAPGVFGTAGAFIGEVAISFGLMAAILFATNNEKLARYATYLVGALYFVYLTFETPLSGMSMNPARSFDSAFRAGYWHGIWIYFVAPALGMLCAGELFLRAGAAGVRIAQSSITLITNDASFATGITTPCFNEQLWGQEGPGVNLSLGKERRHEQHG
jgi:aquaporin Z